MSTFDSFYKRAHLGFLELLFSYKHFIVKSKIATMQLIRVPQDFVWYISQIYSKILIKNGLNQI